MPQISVLTSLYRSGPYIEEFYERCRAALENVSDDYEFVFVDDGSPDDGNSIVQRLIERDAHVRLIELSRNFGQHCALMAGLEHVRGDLVFMIDSDLEENPDLLTTFYRTMMENEDGIDVVYGVMEQRKGGVLERVPGALFYKLMDRMAEVPVPTNVMAARLMKREFVNGLLRFQEADPFVAGMMALTGYKQVAVPCAKASKGKTTYSFRRKLNLALNALISHSAKPLAWITWTGCAIGLGALAAALLLAIQGAGNDVSAPGWIWVLVSVWFLGGLILLAVGVVGVYVGRVFSQVKRRPNAIIRRIHN